MRYILLFIAMTGGLLSFNSFAADCLAGLKLPGTTYDNYYKVPAPGENGVFDYFVNINGCEYLATGDATGWDEISLWSQSFESTGRPAKPGSVPVGSSEDKPDSGSLSGDDSTSPIPDTNSGSSLPDDYAGETAGSTD
ncbi:TPA: hypothetical protein G9F27_005860, partial [Salmonella enterica]|nr:hypothetical protein [Salmonella enterica]